MKEIYFIRSLIYNNVALYGNKKIIIYIYSFIYLFIGGALSAEVIT